MKKLLCSAALTTIMLLPTQLFAADYKIDTDGAHASINFKVSHLGYSFIQGRFNTFEGTFSFDPAKMEASKVQVTVNTQSLDSNHAERDKHFKGSKFIDAGKFSEATFVSTKVSPINNGKFTITGDMTLHGVTKQVDINAAVIGSGDDPWGGYRAGFEGTTRLQVADFGIPVVGASSYVDLDIIFEGIRQ